MSWGDGQHDLHSTVQWFLKIIWWMNIKFLENESVWSDVWSQNKCRSLWPIFHVPVICLIFWRLFDTGIWTSYFGIMSQYDPMFYIKINYGYYDLYFMVQWFCLISWRQFDGWTSYFGIMSQYNPLFDLKCRSVWPIFHGSVILPYILKTIGCMNISMILSLTSKYL